jgi:hypothetical protein
MKEEYYIDKVKKCDVKDLLNTFHYLKDESKDFKVSPYSYGLYRNNVTDVLHIGGEKFWEKIGIDYDNLYDTIVEVIQNTYDEVERTIIPTL